MKHYLIVIEGGTEISTRGPFRNDEERDDEARKLWQAMRPERGDNLFKAQVNSRGEMNTSSFLNKELE